MTATRGQVVTYGGVPVATFFSASSGGHTENVENVWPGSPPAPWLRGVPDPYDGAGGNPYHRWAQTITLAAAAARLKALVHGTLVGVRVLRHGVSGRIVVVEVVGSRGTTRVSGAQLERAFGLPSALASFTTITTTAVVTPALGRTRVARFSWTPARAAEQAMMAVVPALQRLAAAAADGLRGTVFPAHPGSVIAVQVLRRGRWRTVGQVGLGRGGTYFAPVSAAGRYRVVYRGLDGPAVAVR